MNNESSKGKEKKKVFTSKYLRQIYSTCLDHVFHYISLDILVVTVGEENYST
jgi:hypothetical protein